MYTDKKEAVAIHVEDICFRGRGSLVEYTAPWMGHTGRRRNTCLPNGAEITVSLSSVFEPALQEQLRQQKRKKRRGGVRRIA